MSRMKRLESSADREAGLAVLSIVLPERLRAVEAIPDTRLISPYWRSPIPKNE
jgi:hypothetical protein